VECGLRVKGNAKIQEYCCARQEGAALRLFRVGEEHMGRGEVLAFAIVEIEDQVVFGDEVTRMEAEESGGLVDGMVGTFEFDKGADRGFVVVDEEIFGPFVAGGKLVGRAKFLVAEPAPESQTFEDIFQGFSVGQNRFQFFANFVAAVGCGKRRGYGELFGRRFEGQKVTLGRVLWGILLPFFGSYGRFGADAEELAVLGKAAIGSVKDEVVFVDTGGDRFGA
jgi:hypothetical protein